MPDIKELDWQNLICFLINMQVLSVLWCVSAIEQRDPAWYQALCGHLNDRQKKELNEVFKLADQRKAAEGMG